MTILEKNYALAATIFLLTAPAHAAGLDDLSNANPEVQAEEGAQESQEAVAEESEPEETPVEAIAQRKRPLADSFYFATSVGWASASLGEGTWISSGMGDFTIGYKIKNVGFDIFGTYRYAPAAFAGQSDAQAYRGVIEVHNFGGLGVWNIKDKFKVLASAELGLAMVSLDSADGLPVEEELEQTGAIFSLGTGADWKITEKFELGPRLYLGAGTASLFQLSANATMYF